MSRHVANIGLRHLHSLPPRLDAPAAIRPVTSGLLQRSVAASTFGRGFSTSQNAAAKDTRLWRGGLPSIAPQAVRRSAVLHDVLVWRRGCIRETPQIWSQRRLFNERKPLREHPRPSQSTDKSIRDQKGTSEHLHQAQQHAPEGADKSILDRLPHLHRPSKEELLSAATGFWQRMRIRFKWSTIRSVRPYTLDEIGAFASWVFLGHVVWIVIGTTTFVSLAIWAINTVFAQETVAGWVGNYLTKSSGIKVVFESAIVPTWRSGVITFNNVFVSRRPGKQTNRERSVSKGSSTTAAAAAEAAMAAAREPNVDAEDDGNYTQFDVTIQTVNVTLSFRKWFNGKGLLHNVEVLGVRGVIDRTNVRRTEEYVDPKSYRHKHNTGDFEIEDFKMSDVLLTVHQPNEFRPFTVSVFNCELPRLRKQWLFYDFMSANNMSGSFDESLFTVHPRQVHGQTGVALNPDGREDEEGNQWKKHSRLRIDGLNIDHLNRGVDGPFSWIYEGNVDIVADVMIPNDEDGIWTQSWKKSAEAVSEFYDRVEASVTASAIQHHQHQPRHPQTQSFEQGREGPIPASEPAPTLDHRHSQPSEHDRPLILDINCTLTSIRARVPLFTKDLSYVNNALVRPIVAYINSRHGAFIPVQCRVVKSVSEFDGSWTIFDSGLLDDLSREVYGAIARDVEDKGARKRRMRKVGWWGVQVVAQALFIGLAGQLA
ncbi:Mitochondrial distribution and morphology protein 31, mitochondrial precursor [Saxophila tyrrhenica]|uniref:Mitochondrial distribution and morphology protein 31, mitochondrial n=1 Tax=Saxophila tyrrhenica TaxID=1690608 RepID=A0AAV9PKX8_9PEZI|nr:Mitochondrial distribution and morphology protein 31, mitochondrial precursor [Saxophila tyrrhenica]